MPTPSSHITAKPISLPVLHAADTLSTTSLFQDHLLKQKSEKPTLHFTNFDFGVASVLLFAFILFVWLYASNSRRLNQVIKAFYISRFSNQLGRDELSLGNRVSIFLSSLFVITLSLFIAQVINYFQFYKIENEVWFIIQLAALICVIYGFKIVIVRLAGFIFQSQKEVAEYSTMIFLFCNILGLFLLPIVVCIAFVKEVSPLVFIYSGFSIFVLLLFVRLLRGVVIGINSIRVSKFYLFLYLCTLEILPFVIMVKLFVMNKN